MSPPRPHERFAKSAFAAMALGSVLLGIALYLLQARLGIGADTARLVSTALILVGLIDTVVLFLWERLFKRNR